MAKTGNGHFNMLSTTSEFRIRIAQSHWFSIHIKIWNIQKLTHMQVLKFVHSTACSSFPLVMKLSWLLIWLHMALTKTISFFFLREPKLSHYWPSLYFIFISGSGSNRLSLFIIIFFSGR